MATLKNTTVTDVSGFVRLPQGTSVQRPVVPQTGMLRYNTNLNKYELYTGARWRKNEDILETINTTGLILHYDAGSPSSFPGTGTTITDLSGTGNNGTISGATFSTDNGGVLTFDGTNDFISTGLNRGNLGNTFTLCAWFKYTGATSATYQPIWGGQESATEFFFGKDASTTHFGVQDGNYVSNFVKLTYVWNNRWHHMAYTYNNGTGKIYLDGIEVASGSFTKCNDAEGINIGRESEGGGYWWTGQIGPCQIYNRVLSFTEIADNFVAQADRFDVSTLGATAATAAESAAVINQETPGRNNGFFYIRQYGATAFRHYCVFKDSNGNSIEGGPWTTAFRNNYAPNNFSTTGHAAITTFRAQCRTVGVDTPGRGMESFRGTDPRGAWVAVKRAIWEGYTDFVSGKSSAGGGTIAMPIMNINGEGGSSDHRTVYDARFGTTLAPNQDADACNANQLFCGWWGATDISSWTTNDNGYPGPEDWGPANASNTTFGGSGLTPQLLACVYR